MTNQHTSIFFVAPTTLFVVFFLGRHKFLRCSLIMKLFSCVFAGLSFYLYMPVSELFLRSRDNSLTWGDHLSLYGFWTHFTRAEYGTVRLAAGLLSNDSFCKRLWVYVSNFTYDEGVYVVPFLAIVGVVASWRSRSVALRRITRLFVFQYCFAIFVFTWLSQMPLDTPHLLGIQHRFWIQPNLIMCVFVGLGLHVSCNWLVTSDAMFNSHSSSPIRKVAAGHGGSQVDSHSRRRSSSHVLQCLVGAAFTAHLIANNLTALNFRHSTFSQVYRSQLEMLPANSVVLTCGDQYSFLFPYYQLCEGLRGDLSFIPAHRPSSALTEQMMYAFSRLQWPYANDSPAVQWNLGRLPELVDANPSVYFVSCGCGDLNRRTIPQGLCELITLRPALHVNARTLNQTAEDATAFSHGVASLHAMLNVVLPYMTPAHPYQYDSWEAILLDTVAHHVWITAVLSPVNFRTMTMTTLQSCKELADRLLSLPWQMRAPTELYRNSLIEVYRLWLHHTSSQCETMQQQRADAQLRIKELETLAIAETPFL
jgi:hypothetical protein